MWRIHLLSASFSLSLSLFLSYIHPYTHTNCKRQGFSGHPLKSLAEHFYGGLFHSCCCCCTCNMNKQRPYIFTTAKGERPLLGPLSCLTQSYHSTCNWENVSSSGKKTEEKICHPTLSRE